jgi:SAM-dependent methyltransferase
MNSAETQQVHFQCNICETQNTVERLRLTREEPSCSSCGSTVRMRSIIQVLTCEIFGKSMTIPEIDPPRPDIVGIGMSCWHGYAGPIAHRIAYKNTFYHQEPKLDITRIDPAMEGTLDFVVSTDVFEHVLAPVNRAFENTRRLLKPGGVFVFTVPYFHQGEQHVVTTEHFSDLHDYKVVDDEYLGMMLKNRKPNGDTQYFYNLVFHGGPGETLEMRRFSEWSVLEELQNAGFNDLTIYCADDLPFGISWPAGHSAPIAARVDPSAAAVTIRTR